MHVLICDDDPTSRFLVKRQLTQYLACTTSECENGVEALQRLDGEHVDLVMLDMEMPLLDGLEVLEALRASPTLKTVPVVVLSSERRDDVVARVVRLGVDGYLVKPLRTEKVLALLDRLRDKLNRRAKGAAKPSNAKTIRFSKSVPSMLVDGSLDYRHFFLSQTRRFGPVVEASSGAAALALFRQSPTQLVFLGTQLGVLGPELLVPKLRDLAGNQPLRIVGVLDSGAVAHDAYDDVIVKSLIPGKFKEALQSFLPIPAPLAAVTALAGDLSQGVASAVRQVFGMMLDVELADGAAPESKEPVVGASIEISVQQRYVMVMGIRATVASMSAFAGKMVGLPVAEIIEEDYLSTAAELANLISGRVHAHLDESHIASECGLPKMDKSAGTWVLDGAEERGLVQWFACQEPAADLVVSLEVTDLLSH